MEGLFSSEIDESLPELQIFDRMANPAEVEEAIGMYRSLRVSGVPHDKAVDLAVAEVVPMRFSSSADQL